MSAVPSTSESIPFYPDLPDILTEEKKTPSPGVEKPRRREAAEKNVLPEKCSICRNPAVGYHYDVASCNGCKAFFRRTIITGRRYECRSGNKCLEGDEPLDTKKRVCGGCRFSKCEEMGMNPMSIRAEITSEEGKLMRDEMVRKRTPGSSAISTMSAQDELSAVVNKLTLAESQLDRLHSANLPENYGDWRTLSDILASHPNFDVNKIPSLSYLPSQTFPAQAGFAHNSFLSVVEFSKLFDFFTQIQLDSVEKLLKHGTVMLRNMIMSFYSLHRFNSDIIRRPDGTIAGKPLSNYNGIWVEHRKMIQKTLHVFMRNEIDTVEYMLLKAIVLCNPAVQGLPVMDQRVIEDERMKYARCLLTYCTRQHGELRGPDRFGALVSMVSVMELQQREQKNFHVILRSFHRTVTVLVSPLYDEIMSS